MAWSLERELASAGYRPGDRRSVVGGELAELSWQRCDAIVEARDPIAWGRNSARGFYTTPEPLDEDALVGAIVASAAGVLALEAYSEGRLVATGAMDSDGELAGLFAASVLESERGKGWHRALLLDRIARARERGARFARGGCIPGSRSEQNFLRCGFRVLYERTIWQRS